MSAHNVFSWRNVKYFWLKKKKVLKRMLWIFNVCFHSKIRELCGYSDAHLGEVLLSTYSVFVEKQEIYVMVLIRSASVSHFS